MADCKLHWKICLTVRSNLMRALYSGTTAGTFTPMKIGFLGAGSVAKTLGAAFAAAGHDVMLSSRTPENADLTAWRAAAGDRVKLGRFNEAAAFGDLIIPAVQPWTVLQPLLESVGPDALAHKVVIDLGNAVDWSARPPQLALPGSSLGEHMQGWLPSSRVVKTFNTIPAARMADPAYVDGIPCLLMAGNDAPAKQTVRELVRALGWTDVIDLGDIRQSRLLESFMMTLLFAEFATKARGTAFAILRQ
jgi:predicted dinucleotide-binding enzyme